MARVILSSSPEEIEKDIDRSFSIYYYYYIHTHTNTTRSTPTASTVVTLSSLSSI